MRKFVVLSLIAGAVLCVGCGSKEEPAGPTAPATQEVVPDSGTAPAVNMAPPDKGVGTKGSGATGHGIDGR